MSEDHISRMLRFHVSEARFMVSAENFMKVFLLSYDVVLPYEHDRENVAACEGIPQSLQPDGGLYHLAHYMFAAGCRSYVDHFNKFIRIGATMDWRAKPPHPRGHFGT
jgi:hypothetical protein